jgi:hypothetical protein
MATVAQLEAALMKADAAGDEAAAREIAAEIKRTRSRAAAPAKAPRTRGTGIAAIDAPLDVINEALIGVPEGVYNAAAMVTDPIARLIFGKEAVAQAQRQRQGAVGSVSRTFVTQPRPIAREVGRAIGPGAAVSRAATLAAPVLQRAPAIGNVLARVAQRTASGGIGSGRTAAQTAALTKGQRVGQLAERVAGGAIAGGAGAGLTGQDVTEGAAFGAGLPVVGAVLGRLGGKAVDLTRLSKVKAGQIIREALGEDIEAAAAAFRQLSPDDQRLAQQVLVEAGVEPSPFFGLGRIATSQMDPDTTARILAQQEAARTARLAEAAGGETATMQRSAAETGRRGVTEVTGPTREAALTRANVAGRVVPEAEALAEAARQQAAEQSGLARRMTFGAERAETRLGQADDLGDVFNPEAVARERGIAGAMTQRGEQAAQQAIGLRQQARDMEDVVADLAAEGMQPLTVAPISQSIRAMAAAPGTRASKLQRRALVTAANQLDALADANGVIDARDLYQFRKSELGDIVNVLLSGRNMPPSGVKEGAAKLMGDIRPMIDDAIEGAGGVGFKDYLTRTRQGFEAINRQELAARGAQLAKESPDEFTALMRGERPKVVEDIMGKGTKQYDIGGMALADPARYLAMKTSADELETLNKMAQLGARGEPRAGNILRSQQPGLLSRGLGTLVRAKFPAVAFAGTGAQNVESALVNPNVQREIANAFTSGQGALQAMEQYPTAAQFSAYLSTLPSPVRNAFAQAMRAYAQQPSSN